MEKIIITVVLGPEFGFTKYMAFRQNEEKFTFNIGEMIQIAHTDCRISKSLGDNTFEVEVLTSDLTLLPNRLLAQADMNADEAKKLIEYVSCEDSKAECDFYLNKESYFRKILTEYLEHHKLEQCPTCGKYIQEKSRFLKKNDESFCSFDCINIHDSNERHCY